MTPKKMSSGAFKASIVAAMLLPALVCAQSADEYPNRPVRVIQALTAGGAVDVMARMAAAKLSENLKRQFFVDTRQGAGGIIGYTAVAKAAPDGYTLLAAGSGYTIASVLQPIEYDPIKDIVPIGAINETYYLLVSHPLLPVKSVKDLIALAKAKPDAINYGTGGVGSAIHFAMEQFALSAGGLKFSHIAYVRGNPMNDLVAGEIQVMMVNMTSALPRVREGRLRSLGISLPRRSEVFPEFPTIAESGLPGFSRTGWIAYFAPSGTPPNILKKLNAEMAIIVKDPVIAKRIRDMGGEPAEPLEQFKKTVVNDFAVNRKIAERANIKPNN
jgi:tripartite-type tricarboxylate transporter receptor subunit TctC